MSLEKPFEFDRNQKETLCALLDTFIAPLSTDQTEVLVEKLRNTHTEEEVRQFCQVSSTSLGTIQATMHFIENTIIAKKRMDISKLLSVLSTRPGTFLLTGHTCQFKNLGLKEREKVVLAWKNSYVASLRMIYKSFNSLACHPAFKTYPELLSPMHYDLKNDIVYENVPERLVMMERVNQDMRFDAIVIGSGGGGGVVASQLAQAGKSVLVIEKGKYYHEHEFIHKEAVAFTNLYENGGVISTLNGSASILAGSVFGGGTTVNWSACLKLPHFIRDEWANLGLSYFKSPKFTHDLDRVFKRLGASTEGIKHNGANQVLVNGCKALGFPVADIAQNTGGAPHECNNCFMGCRAGIKNSTTNSWLRDASQYGAKFLDNTKANTVLIENGKAVGVECLVNGQKICIKADQVVVSGGSLQSPGILKRSGLKNDQIGKNLFLHPCSIVMGYFDRKINAFEGSIMTAISTVAENTKGDGYGCRLEVSCVHPSTYSSIMPWRGSADFKKNMLRYEQCAPILILTRDKDSNGTVTYDKDDNLIVDYNLSYRDSQSITEGIVRSLEILVAAGAREVHSSQFAIEPFVFESHEESRVDNPRFVAWRDNVAKHGFPPASANMFCAHQMGSNRMGISPKRSVVKPTGESWEVKNLYVADASVFPTSSGVNPMITTQTIALHISDCIINDSKSKL